MIDAGGKGGGKRLAEIPADAKMIDELRDM